MLSNSRTDRLSELKKMLEPKLNREQALEGLDELFGSGSAPDPTPGGFKLGELVTTSIARAPDASVRAISSLYMPWLGKSFDPENQTGINVLKPSAKAAMKVLWPNYEVELERADRIEAFPF